MNDLAPIVLFVYNRLEHTKRTIQSLKKNKLANDSDLYVFSDGAKTQRDYDKVQQVREYVRGVDGFNSVRIIVRNKNWGLADSIVNGVTDILNKYEKVIVLEDDLILSSCFLRFMNDALNFYQKEQKVWHLSGWNYPINIDINKDVYLTRIMNCWGWATWRDRWESFQKDSGDLIATFTDKDIRKFNLDGANDFWKQVVDNHDSIIDTWAIFWYASIFKHSGLCVNPTSTYVNNIGFDGSGTHCLGRLDFMGFESCDRAKLQFTTELHEGERELALIKKYYNNKLSIRRKFLNFIKMTKKK